MITPADSAPVAPGQMPQANTPGPAPVPFTGDQSAGNAPLGPFPTETHSPGVNVLQGVTGANYVAEAPWAAPNVNPYEAGAISPIYVGGDNDPGGRDDVAGSVAEAVHAAEARFAEHQTDTYGQGSTIGDIMTIPPRSSDGKITYGGGYYDAPRDYDGGQL